MSLNDISVFFDVFGDFRYCASFLIIECLVEEGEGIFDF